MLSRRTFLADGLRVAALLPLLPRRSPFAVGSGGQRTLVVIQLTGGNDGLNTVVPWRQDSYYRSRPTLGLDSRKLHPLGGNFGLHPALVGFAHLFEEGRLTIVQGVGHPQATRSHFESLAIWHHAGVQRPKGGAGSTGWLGRMGDQLLARSPGAIPAMHVGADAPSPALLGRSVTPLGLDSPADLILRAPQGVAIEDLAPGLAAKEEGELAYVRAVAHAAQATGRRLANLDLSAAGDEYPEGELSRKLRLVARLVLAGPGTTLFSLTLGGFDTHAQQAATHAALLQQLSDALEAFERDLRKKGVAERVATFVFSEFGRRVSENGSRGTDHGLAAPVFLLGGPGRGGALGNVPDLGRLVEGDIPHEVDFRSLYTALERDWMELEPSTGHPAFTFGS